MNFQVPAVAPARTDVSYSIPQEVEITAPQEESVSLLQSVVQTLPEVILPEDEHGLLMRVQRLEGVRAASLLDPNVVQALAIVQRNFTAGGFGIELGLQSDFGPIELFGVGDNLVAVVLDPAYGEELREKVRGCLAKVRRYIA